LTFVVVSSAATAWQLAHVPSHAEHLPSVRVLRLFFSHFLADIYCVLYILSFLSNHIFG
jgi:hypothetical protein